MSLSLCAHCRSGLKVGAEIWKEDERRRFQFPESGGSCRRLQFSESGASLNCPGLCSELPFPVEFLTKPSFFIPLFFTGSKRQRGSFWSGGHFRKLVVVVSQKHLGEDAPRVSSRWQTSFLVVKNVVKFLVTHSKLFFLGKIDRKCATKNPPHFSLLRFQHVITLTFWDHSGVRSTGMFTIVKFFERGVVSNRDS